MRYCRVNTVPPMLVIRKDEADGLALNASTSWDYVEVPTDKVGLMAHINALIIDISTAPPQTRALTRHQVCAGIHGLEAHELAQVTHALGRRITDLTGGHG